VSRRAILAFGFGGLAIVTTTSFYVRRYRAWASRLPIQAKRRRPTATTASSSLISAGLRSGACVLVGASGLFVISRSRVRLPPPAPVVSGSSTTLAPAVAAQLPVLATGRPPASSSRRSTAALWVFGSPLAVEVDRRPNRGVAELGLHVGRALPGLRTAANTCLSAYGRYPTRKMRTEIRIPAAPRTESSMLSPRLRAV
jgi:hypothetical protein